MHCTWICYYTSRHAHVPKLGIKRDFFETSFDFVFDRSFISHCDLLLECGLDRTTSSCIPKLTWNRGSTRLSPRLRGASAKEEYPLVICSAIILFWRDFIFILFDHVLRTRMLLISLFFAIRLWCSQGLLCREGNVYFAGLIIFNCRISFPYFHALNTDLFLLYDFVRDHVYVSDCSLCIGYTVWHTGLLEREKIRTLCLVRAFYPEGVYRYMKALDSLRSYLLYYVLCMYIFQVLFPCIFQTLHFRVVSRGLNHI